MCINRGWHFPFSIFPPRLLFFIIFSKLLTGHLFLRPNNLRCAAQHTQAPQSFLFLFFQSPFSFLFSFFPLLNLFLMVGKLNSNRGLCTGRRVPQKRGKNNNIWVVYRYITVYYIRKGNLTLRDKERRQKKNKRLEKYKIHIFKVLVCCLLEKWAASRRRAARVEGGHRWHKFVCVLFALCVCERENKKKNEEGGEGKRDLLIYFDSICLNVAGFRKIIAETEFLLFLFFLEI